MCVWGGVFVFACRTFICPLCPLSPSETHTAYVHSPNPTPPRHPLPSSPQSYPLAGRGVCVVTGDNRDVGEAADSNGAGKTTLVAAALWALTGSMLARTEVR